MISTNFRFRNGDSHNEWMHKTCNHPFQYLNAEASSENEANRAGDETVLVEDGAESEEERLVMDVSEVRAQRRRGSSLTSSEWGITWEASRLC